MLRRRLWTIAAVLAIALAGALYAAGPYLRAAALVVRAASLGGRAEAFADARAAPVEIHPAHEVPTRYGHVSARFYVPAGAIHRTVLLVPGIHSMGIDEPRLTALAEDLAGSGLRVMTMALPDLQRYLITPRATDVIEDATLWLSRQAVLAPDGTVGLIGISFAGGLSQVAASRPSIRDKVAYVLAFGGHGSLPRVLRYLATGEAPAVAGLSAHPPHDYGVAVILYGFADRGVVPPEQVAGLRRSIETFLLASQLTLVSMDQANATFAEARTLAAALPEPARTYAGYVNDRAVDKLGPALLPYVDQVGDADMALSPARVEHPVPAPIYLLHGSDDTVIPAAESALLADDLRRKGADVHLLLSGLITHAEVNRAATTADAWRLVSFWADVLSR